jgi:uncharacterized Rmd1/YagE family protein
MITQASIPAPVEPDRVVARAFDYASAYDLKAARDLLPREKSAKVLDADPLIVQIRSRAVVAVFEYGSCVFFNIEDAECRRIIDMLRPAAIRPNRSISTDEFLLNLGARQKAPAGTEELTVREFNRDIVTVVGVVLSRSVALEYYENLLNGTLERLEQTVAALAATGRIPRGERRLTRQVGLGLLIEYELAYSVSAFDDPDIIWDAGEKIVRLYRQLKREFDLDDRIKVIHQKVSLISRWSTFVISRLEGHRARMLEWIIIVLIAAEILLALAGRL